MVTPPAEVRISLEGINFVTSCSFCGKEAEKEDSIELIIGPQVSICSECVEICAELLKEKAVDTKQ